MKLYLLERIEYAYDEDYAMVVVAENEINALKLARSSSIDFELDMLNNISIKSLDTDKELCALVRRLDA